MTLALEALERRYGRVRAVDGVSLTLAEGETVALLGPSGCGKSTLLRLVAGLEAPDGGRVLQRGHDVTRTPPHLRGFGMVFQDYALFPHLDVGANVAFGLVERHWPRERIRARVTEALERVDLAGFERRRVHELSGGQQQRVALARALAPEPPLLLLDEPLSNLDAGLREELGAHLGSVLAEGDVAALYVTHDQSEAFALADRVALMRAGRIVQVDTPHGLYARPATVWAAAFLGHANVYPLEQAHAFLDVRTGLEPAATHVLLRADLVTLAASTGEGVRAHVRSVASIGGEYRLELELPGGASFRWRGFTRELPYSPEVGGELYLGLPARAIVGIAGSP